MTIYSVFDPAFKPYGRVVTGYETECAAIVRTLKEKTPIPAATDYVPEEPAVQSLPEAQAIAPSLFGGIPAQFGWCNGHNTKLNCLEYHRNSEFNLGTEDFILLLAKQDEMTDWVLDSSCVKAFRVPAGVMVEVYATTLHYAPCQAARDKGFQVLVVLPKGTNVGTAKTPGKCPEDRLLFASNKWLIAHKDAAEVKNGAFVGITGENIDIAGELE